MKKAAVLLLAVALASGCNSGPKHVATVASSGAQSALVIAAGAEQQGYERGLITPAVHLANVKKLRNAAALHEDAVKLILAAPSAGSPPPEYAAMLAQALALLQDVIEALPAGPSKVQAKALASKGLF